MNRSLKLPSGDTVVILPKGYEQAELDFFNTVRSIIADLHELAARRELKPFGDYAINLASRLEQSLDTLERLDSQ